MKKFLITLFAAALCAGSAQAVHIDYLEEVALPTVTIPHPSGQASKATTGISQPHDQGGGIAPWVNGLITDPNCVVELFASWNFDNGWESFAPGFDSSMFKITTTIANGASSADIEWDLTGTGYGLFFVTGHQGGGVKTNLNEVTGGAYVTGHGSIDAPGNGNGWSNMRFLGKKVATVPDSGSTLIFLGAVLSGLAIANRRRK